MLARLTIRRLKTKLTMPVSIKKKNDFSKLDIKNSLNLERKCKKIRLYYTRAKCNYVVLYVVDIYQL